VKQELLALQVELVQLVQQELPVPPEQQEQPDLRVQQELLALQVELVQPGLQEQDSKL
jgi:hypothetical protein